MARNKASKAFERMLRAKGMIPESPPKGSAESVVLPLPPSTNELFWARGRGRTKTTKYREWIEDAFPIAESLREPAKYPVAVVLTVEGNVNRQRDLDNFCKPVLDLIKKAGAIKNDNLCHISTLVVRCRPDAAVCGVRVHFEEAS